MLDVMYRVPTLPDVTEVLITEDVVMGKADPEFVMAPVASIGAVGASS
jgi:ATP-dependent protease Clp ATPase subunit